MNDGSPLHPYVVALVAFAIVVVMFAVDYPEVREGNFTLTGITTLILLPTFIASGRLHRNTNDIFACSLTMLSSMLGAMVLRLPLILAEVGLVVGWLITMVWSLTASREQRKIFALHFSPSGSRFGADAGSREWDYPNALNDNTGASDHSETDNDHHTSLPPMSLT